MSSLATSIFSFIAATCRAVWPLFPDFAIRSGCFASIFDADLHYENMSMQYTVIFKVVEMKIFNRKFSIVFLFLLKT